MRSSRRSLQVLHRSILYADAPGSHEGRRHEQLTLAQLSLELCSGLFFDLILIALGFLRKRIGFGHTGLTTVLTTLILDTFQIIFLGQNVTPWPLRE